MTSIIDVVPIGKYKGKPLDHLMADQPYTEWLLAQAWFVDRYAELAHLLRMGRLNEPQDTPEHNAMVAGLIDQRDAMECLAEGMRHQEELFCARMDQEVEPKGADIRILFDFVELMVEAKPLIGDDFPSVIRQVKAGMVRRDYSHTRAIVITRRVEPTNLTFEQVRRQFDLSGVRLVMESEVFEAGRSWAATRSAYLSDTITAVEGEIEKVSTDLADAEATREAHRYRWDLDRNVGKLAEALATSKDRLARLLAVQSVGHGAFH